VNSKFFWRGLIIGLFLTIRCHSIGVKNLRIDDLVRTSDVIAIADITEVKTIGPAQPILFGDQLLQADEYSSDLVVRRIIKGTVADYITVRYALPRSFVGYRGLQRGTRIVFLRREQGHYSPADPYYPDFPAMSSVSGNKGFQPATADYATIVVHEMVAVIASPTASSAEKSQVLQVDYEIPASHEAVVAFREGVANAQGADLRQRLQGELIRLGDMTELPEVVHLLVTNTATGDQRMWLLYVIGNSVGDRRVIPALEPLLRSTDSSLRSAAVEALWHIADPGSVPELLRDLQDPDEQVRFYAVRAFSDIANEPGWGGPGESQFEEHQGEYLQHWRNWAHTQAR
jgi:hypothetical protein